MKIINHYPSAVETIIVKEIEKKVIVENQCYSLTGRKTKTYIKTYELENVPTDIGVKIREEILRLEEEEKNNES